MGFVFNSGVSGVNARLRREDCEFVKHDRLFSDWKILVGPSDWREVQGARRSGTGRYYMQNLPAMELGPGVFELGVTAPAWSPAPREHNQRAQPLRREDVIPVYVSQAANIRQRLQKFGQAAALLEPSSRSAKLYQGDENSDMLCRSSSTSPRVLQNGGGEAKSFGGSGPRLFSEVFALGSSIAFRWAHTDSKAVAEQVEAELLVVFDYAWNKGVSGNRRSRDILAKLFMAWPTKEPSTSSKFNSWNPISSSKRSFFCCRSNAVGIKVALRKPHDNPTPKSKTGFNLCFLMTVQPQVPYGAKTVKGNASPAVRGGKHSQQQKRVTPAGGTKTNIISATKLDHVSVRRLGVNHGWRLGFQSCFPTTSRRLPCKKRAANTVMEEQPSTVERRRPCSLSFNTWVKLEADDQRVHSNGDADAGHSPHMKQKNGQPRISGMDSKRRTRTMRFMYAPLPADDSKRG